MKTGNLFILVILVLLSFSCVPLERISRHDFDSGYFKLKTPEIKSSEVYADFYGDSVVVHRVSGEGKSKKPDLSLFQGIRISEIKSGSFLYNSTFFKNSFDFDLSTIITKYRPSSSEVPNQLSSNINAALYFGIRRDYYILKSHLSPLKAVKTYIRHIGFDAGVFAGIGITPVNPTVTNDQILLEYDGMVFQKGAAGFITIGNMSVGIALGFDRLLDKNSKVWIYNQKPWVGLVLGIANF
jgi:hypothetical protein